MLRVGGDYGDGAGWKSILWAFFGACARFSMAGGMEYRKNKNPAPRSLKRLFDSTPKRKPAGGYPTGCKIKGAVDISAPDNISDYLTILSQNRFATFALHQNGA